MSCRICAGHSECLRSVLEVKPGVFFDSFRGLGREVLSLRGFWFNARTGLGIRRGISRPGSRTLGFGKGSGVNAFRVERMERGEDVSSYFGTGAILCCVGMAFKVTYFFRRWMSCSLP